MATKCPICGVQTLSPRHGEFQFTPPDNIPGGVMVVPETDWLECSTCGERILSPELSHAIEALRYERLGLLTPEEIKAVRDRTGLSQEEMSKLIGVGDKTYTRWESGRSIQNKSSDNLIRAVDLDRTLFLQLEAQRGPDRKRQVADYVRGLATRPDQGKPAIAAHGGEVDPETGQALLEKIRTVIKERGESGGCV